jgi:ethanolamine utilization protein EutP (predicted NTPase)
MSKIKDEIKVGDTVETIIDIEYSDIAEGFKFVKPPNNKILKGTIFTVDNISFDGKTIISLVKDPKHIGTLYNVSLTILKKIGDDDKMENKEIKIGDTVEHTKKGVVGIVNRIDVLDDEKIAEVNKPSGEYIGRFWLKNLVLKPTTSSKYNLEIISKVDMPDDVSTDIEAAVINILRKRGIDPIALVYVNKIKS